MTHDPVTARSAERSDTSERLWPSVVIVTALATLPYLSLVAVNVGEDLDLSTVGVWWSATLVAALVVVGAVRLWRRSATRRVAVVAGVALYLFFNYPAITSLQRTVGLSFGDLVWWAAASAVLLTVAAAVAGRTMVQRFVLVVAPALLLAPGLQLVTAVSAHAEAVEAGRDGGLLTLEQTPNVYWFVLDGLAGVSYLDAEVGVDTEPFVAELEAAGFDVLEQAHTNYPFTHLAISSTLEMEYVYDGVEEPPAGPYYATMRGDNRTVDTFLANGYDYVHAYPGLWSGSRCGGREDVCLGAHGPLTDTEWALASATPLIDVIVDTKAHASIARTNDPVAVVDEVIGSSAADPYYAFIHLLNPHPPYLRDADCGLREVPLSFAAWGEGPEYRDAVTCLFDRLEAAVDRILATDDDPVIVITGDHGPRLGLSAETEGRVLLDSEMFFSAFNAIRLPAACDGTEIAEDMTFVNTFRVVFACLAGEEPDLLEDRLFPIRRNYG